MAAYRNVCSPYGRRDDGVHMVYVLLACIACSSGPAAGYVRDQDWIREAPEIALALSKEISERWQKHSHWEPEKYPPNQSPQPGGRTAFAVLALLSSGVHAQRSDVSAALKSLENTRLTSTYAVAARILAFCRLPESRLKRARQDVATVLSSVGGKHCGWGYSLESEAVRFDPCICQFVTLALSDAADRGIRVPSALFDYVRMMFMNHQRSDGGWAYQAKGAARGSMTAAGYATLRLCQRHPPAAKTIESRARSAITRAASWLSKHADSQSNPGSESWIDYWLLSIGRAADTSGEDTFGSFNCSRHGTESIARRLLARTKDGWRVRKGAKIRVEKLCFALIFLQRAISPLGIGWMSFQAESVDHVGMEKINQELTRALEKKIQWRRVSSHIHANHEPVPVVMIDFESGLPAEDALDSVVQVLAWYRTQGSVCMWLSSSVRGARATKTVSDILYPARKWTPYEITSANGIRHTCAVMRSGPDIEAIHVHGIDIENTSNSLKKRAVDIAVQCWMDITGGIVWPRFESTGPKALSGPQVHVRIEACPMKSALRAHCVKERLHVLHSLPENQPSTRPQLHQTTHRDLMWCSIDDADDISSVDVSRFIREGYTCIFDLSSDLKLLEACIQSIHALGAGIVVTACPDATSGLGLDMPVLCIRFGGKTVGHIIRGMQEHHLAMPFGIPEQRGLCGIQTIWRLVYQANGDV